MGTSPNLFYLSTAGLEPARVSPHAPQTCTYTDSVTSTRIINFFNLYCFCLVFVSDVESCSTFLKQYCTALLRQSIITILPHIYYIIKNFFVIKIYNPVLSNNFNTSINEKTDANSLNNVSYWLLSSTRPSKWFISNKSRFVDRNISISFP